MVGELRALDFVVRGADLHAYADSPVPDIKTGVDVFELKSLAVYRFVVTNLPYREQAAILVHLPPIAARKEPLWRSWRSPNGARRRPAVCSCTRMRGSPEKAAYEAA